MNVLLGVTPSILSADALHDGVGSLLVTDGGMREPRDRGSRERHRLGGWRYAPHTQIARQWRYIMADEPADNSSRP